MSRHYVWLVTLNDSLIDAFMGRMVREGYEVSALAETGDVTWATTNADFGKLSAFNVMFKRSRSRSQTMSDIKNVLKDLEFSYLGLIVSEPGGTTWCSGVVRKIKEPGKTEETQDNDEDDE